MEDGASRPYDSRMPIYEYLCESCGMVNEKLQKVSDPPPARCDECGSRKLAKLVSRSAFQLKGGGWYSDLYASKKKEAPAKAETDSTPPAKTESKAEAKADPKPAAKPEPVKAPAVDGPPKKERKKPD